MRSEEMKALGTSPEAAAEPATQERSSSQRP